MKEISNEFGLLYESIVGHLMKWNFFNCQIAGSDGHKLTVIRSAKNKEILEEFVNLEKVLEAAAKCKSFKFNAWNFSKDYDMGCCEYKITLMPRTRNVQGKGSYIAIEKERITLAEFTPLYRAKGTLDDLIFHSKPVYKVLINQDDFSIMFAGPSSGRRSGFYPATGKSLEKLGADLISLIFGYYEKTCMTDDYPLYDRFASELLNKEELEPVPFKMPISLKDIKECSSVEEWFEKKFKIKIPEGYDDLKLKTLYAVGCASKYIQGDSLPLFEKAEEIEPKLFSFTNKNWKQYDVSLFQYRRWIREKDMLKGKPVPKRVQFISRMTRKKIAYCFLSEMLCDEYYGVDAYLYDTLIVQNSKVDIKDPKTKDKPLGKRPSEEKTLTTLTF